jgi:predicted transcriptional regulator of viral defense system
MPESIREKVLELAHRQGVLRPRDLHVALVPREYLRRMVDEGLLERRSRGLYVAADFEPDEQQDLLEACKRVSHGVICLLSALRFHGLTTQAPFEIWMAIGIKARHPRVDYPPLHIVRFSPQSLRTGVTDHVLRGVVIRVTDPARTVVDCFVYRHKIGLDVALEALRDCWRQKKASMDELHGAAQARRMANVMRPYLESLV